MSYAAGSIISADMLASVGTEVLGAIPTIATVGIPIMVALMAFRLIPKVLKMFAK